MKRIPFKTTYLECYIPRESSVDLFVSNLINGDQVISIDTPPATFLNPNSRWDAHRLIRITFEDFGDADHED